MARPAQANAAVTQARILRAAMRRFAEEGTGNVSIRAIAADAGVTLATVHHYFGRKEQLYNACIVMMYAELEHLRDQLEPAFDEVSGPDELIDHVVRQGFRFAWSHRGALRLLMRTIIDAGHIEYQHRQKVHLPFLDQASKLLARMFDRKRAEMRLTVQSLMHLTVRYALTDAEELALLAGTNEEQKTLAAIEDHLVSAAFALLGRK